MSASAPYAPDPYQAETYTAEAVSAEETRILKSYGRIAFWLALGAAVISVVIGVMMIVWPEATLKVVAVLFGLWLLLYGVVRIVQSITDTARDAGERAIRGVIGLLFVVAGVLALRNLFVSLAVVITVVGLMWLLGGVLELISALGGPGGATRAWNAGLGVVSIIGGLVVLIWPDLSVVVLVYLTGAWLILTGLIQVALVFWARRAIRT